MAINTQMPHDYGYLATYNGKRCEVYAPTSYRAQQLAVEFWKLGRKQGYRVNVTLCERPDGSPVIHVAE
jgi:hypothetical protein